MKLSSKARYAVMAMVDLGFHGHGRPVSLAEIASRQDISLSYLEQLFGKLRRAGLVESVRGPGGGYLLAHGRHEIVVAQIVDAVDEPIRVTRCKGGPDPEPGCMKNRSKCLTHDLWDELGNHIRDFMSSVTLDDICEKRVCRQVPDLNEGAVAAE
jgi:Rrf2 family iron-sulfur cluster assembly transcriptional regulator